MDKKKATTNPIIKKDNKCFQYAARVGLNQEEIKKDLQKITKIEPFINKYNWKEYIFYQKKTIEKNLRKNNVTTPFNFFYVKKRKNISCLCFKT